MVVSTFIDYMQSIIAEKPTLIWLGVAFVFSIINFCILANQKPSREQQQVMLITLLSAIEMSGYFLREISPSEGGAVIAQKIILFGGSFLTYITYCFYMNFCKRRIPKAANVILFAIAITNAAFSLTFDMHTLMYKTYTPVKHGLTYVLDTTPAIWQYVYQITALGLVIAIIVIAVLFGHSKKASKKKKTQSFILALYPVLSMVGYIVDDVYSAKDLYASPICMFFANAILLILVLRSDLYDMNNAVREETFNATGNGLLAVGKDNAFQGANPLAISMFPFLEDIAINEVFIDDHPELLELLEKKKKEYVANDRTYKVSVRDIKKKGIEVGKTIWFEDVTDHRKLVKLLMDYQDQLEKDVISKNENIRNMQNQVIIGMSDIIESRDGNTGGHVKRTSAVVEILTRAMLEDEYPGLTRIFCEMVIKTAPMHDIGKIAIPDSILGKPGKLTDEEFEVMKSHSQKGAELADVVLQSIENEDVLNVTRNIAHFHHEKWNGLGYPNHLKEEEIPLEARIMAIADVYDALVSKRCYKEPMPFEQAYSIMEESFGNHFDPSLKKYFDLCRDDIEALYAKDREEA